jgi:hypothetical protein
MSHCSASVIVLTSSTNCNAVITSSTDRNAVGEWVDLRVCAMTQPPSRIRGLWRLMRCTASTCEPCRKQATIGSNVFDSRAPAPLAITPGERRKRSHRGARVRPSINAAAKASGINYRTAQRIVEAADRRQRQLVAVGSGVTPTPPEGPARRLIAPPRCHMSVTTPRNLSGRRRTYKDVFSDVRAIGGRRWTPANTPNRLPKLNTRVRFPSSAPLFSQVRFLRHAVECQGGWRSAYGPQVRHMLFAARVCCRSGRIEREATVAIRCLSRPWLLFRRVRD